MSITQTESKPPKIIIEFQQFRAYCQKVSEALNEIQGYASYYRVSDKPFLKEHDGEFLEVEHRGETIITKINMLYSLPYRIPILYFMPYDQELKPIACDRLGQFYKKLGTGELLSAENVETGVYITQNPISKQYMYTLHSCQLSMEINYLLPYYFSLLNLHPQIPKI